MALFKSWQKLARVIREQLDCFFYEKLMPALEEILFSSQFANYIEFYTKKGVKEYIESEEFQNIICLILKECNVSPFKEIAQQLLGKEVEITVTVGILTGVISQVGDDFLTLQESAGSIILLPFTSILSIREL
ncbi:MULTISPECIES: DUF2642 domain-containing protein [unclassified Bacillus (in: firmicutes)]|uniref:DUF2642 domain-containing protein n=1 Tax=unclassified Bacillus (in: firmicutes) TaxID=185979 RepID=UPI0008E04416|nr:MULTISPECIES: DUF2642 domain-containing protein [unclassified Bacillus (in: firmicutes)]SFJ41038.1 hypothetical protein SAMN04488574_11253 [Bacillus sp. 71mf]SFT15305.1 hypothetical protein SAMN04488145_11453 [Bacillus sp. 103mf]